MNKGPLRSMWLPDRVKIRRPVSCRSTWWVRTLIARQRDVGEPDCEEHQLWDDRKVGVAYHGCVFKIVVTSSFLSQKSLEEMRKYRQTSKASIHSCRQTLLLRSRRLSADVDVVVHSNVVVEQPLAWPESGHLNYFILYKACRRVFRTLLEHWQK